MSGYRERDPVLFQRRPGGDWERGTYDQPVELDRRGVAHWHLVLSLAGIVVRVPSRRLKAAPPQTSIRFAAVHVEGDSSAVAELGSILADALAPKKDDP